MIGLERGKVILAEYDEDWANEFENEKNSIRQALSDYNITIEHIGSTSVRSLCAKPIIDILIGIDHLNDGLECIHDLEAIGYEYKAENGVPGRHFFAKGNPRTHHLHIVEMNSDLWHEHLSFRDYLRTNLDARIKYSKLIREGAKGIPPLSINVLNNRKTFVKYIYDIHNYINKFKPLEGNQIRFEPPSLKSVALFYNSKLSVGSKKLNI